MAVGCRLAVDRAQQVQVLDHAERSQVEDLADRVGDALLGKSSGAEGIDVQADRACSSNRVSQLNLAALGDTRSHDVLGHPAGSVRRGAINLRRILSGERATAVAGHAAVGVDDDLATRQARICGRPAQHEATGGVNESLHLTRSQSQPGLLNDGVDDVGTHGVRDGGLRQGLVVLGRHDDGVDTDRTAALVGESHLSLTVGAQPLDDALFAHVGEALGQAVRQPDRSRHEVRGVRGSVAKHDALVARTEAVARIAAVGATHLERLVNAARNIGTLPVKRDGHAAGRAVKADARGVVSDRKDLAAHDLGDLDVRLGGHLAGDMDETGCGHRLDSNARVGIRIKQGVEDRIGDTVTDLVGVTFGDGLGREKLLTHRSRLSRKAAI